MSTDAVPPPPPSTPTATEEDIEKNKVFAIISYLWLLWLVPLLVAKDSRFAKFHANEGLVLFLAGIAVGIALSVLFAPLIFIPFLAPLIPLMGSIAWIGFLVLTILGIINAATGKMKHLPVIGGRFTLIK